MIAPLRRRHRLMWILLAPLIILGFVVALMSRTEAPISPLPDPATLAPTEVSE